jgi:putative DNA primase/helicase
MPFHDKHMSAIDVNSDSHCHCENDTPPAGAARASAETVKPLLEILLTVGEQARVTDAVLAMIQEDGLLYERGDTLVRPCGDRLITVDEHWLADYFSRRIAFSRMKTKDGAIERVAADPPNWLCKRINAKSGERGIPELAGILSQPTMRADGSLLDAPGYDAATGLLLRPGDWPTIPTQPRRSDLEVAWQTL